MAAVEGHEQCLRVVAELAGAYSLRAVDNNGCTPGHKTALRGHGQCLGVVAELAGADSLRAAAINGHIPALMAAVEGHEQCPVVLAALGAYIASERCVSPMNYIGHAPFAMHWQTKGTMLLHLSNDKLNRPSTFNVDTTLSLLLNVLIK